MVRPLALGVIVTTNQTVLCVDSARLEGESQEDYRKRRKMVHRVERQHLKGRLVWDSKNGPAKRKQPK